MLLYYNGQCTDQIEDVVNFKKHINGWLFDILFILIFFLLSSFVWFWYFCNTNLNYVKNVIKFYSKLFFSINLNDKIMSNWQHVKYINHMTLGQCSCSIIKDCGQLSQNETVLQDLFRKIWKSERNLSVCSENKLILWIVNHYIYSYLLNSQVISILKYSRDSRGKKKKVIDKAK